MRVLMLGWDFSPRLSGGVGSACQGLANALARAAEPDGAEVLFVLPRARGDEEPENVRLLSSEDAQAASRRAPPAPVPAPLPAREASGGAGAASPAPRGTTDSGVVAPARPGPGLPAPSESLRLLAVDSPLTPYLGPLDYEAAVRALLARIRAPVRAPRAPAAVPVATASPAVAARAAPLAAALPDAPVRVPPYGLTLLSEVERYARSVLALVHHESFDLIHAHDWMTFPAALLLKERTSKPLVVHMHSSEAERRGARGSADVRAIERAALAEAERVVCVSERSARTLRDHYPVERARLRVVHNAFTPVEGAAPAGADAQADSPVVLFLGRLARQKGPDVFLRAAARVHERHPEARFVLAGEGELYPEISALARELGLEACVRFTGFVAGRELAETYASAAVYVMPSASEPFGIGALEALALGVPTVVSREAGVTEVVRSVLRFEAGDDEELADKIVSLLERPALRRQLIDSGLCEVRKLRWERPARALRGIYDELVVRQS